MEQSEKSRANLAEAIKNLQALENLLKEGKDRDHATAKEIEGKIRSALEIPKEMWMNSGQTLKEVIERLHKHLEIVQNSVRSSGMISDKDVLSNASGGVALEGVYKTRNYKDMLVKREQLIQVPDSFTLANPKHSATFEQKEFTSHSSATDFQKAMEKQGHSFSTSLSVGFKGFGLSFGVEKNKSKETEETSSHSREESYILCTKYNYVPLASAFLQKNELKLSPGALNALQEIENISLYSLEQTSQINKVRCFYERFGSHANQGTLHFGGVFWWRASSSGFKTTDQSEVKELASESLGVYCSAGFGFGAFSISGKVATSSSHLKGHFTGKHREELMSQVQLSISKTGGPSEIDDHLQWKLNLATNNKTWSVIDRGVTLIPVWEILKASHRDDFKDVSTLSRLLMDAYKEITGENVQESTGENILTEIGRAKTLIQEVKGWSATSCESYLTQLLDFKTRLFEKTGSNKIWFLECLSNDVLQNYLFKVITENSKSKAVNFRTLMRSLLEPDFYELKNFPNRKAIVDWAYQTEKDFLEQVSVSKFSDLERVLQSAQKELEQSRHAFSSAEEERSAKTKATNTITLALNSFCKTLGENDQKEAELLIISIISVIGYSGRDKIFNHILNMNDVVFLQSELQNAFSKYTSLRELSPMRAQAYFLLTALTVSTDKDVAISAIEKQERLQFIQTQLRHGLSVFIESVIQKMLNDWEALESALSSIMDGSQISDGNATVEEAVRQLENLLGKEATYLSETTDEHNTPVNTKGEKAKSFMDLLLKLDLKDYYPQKLTKENVLTIDRLSLRVKEPQTEKDLRSLYLYKLMTLNYKTRYLFVKPEKNAMHSTEDASAVDDGEDFFDLDDKPDEVVSSKPEHIHPMDLQLAIFHCSSDFLRQYIYTKLCACQFSVPLLVPNPCTDEVEFPLWALRHIIKSWHSKTQTSASSVKYHNRQMFNTPVPIVSFFRIGVSDLNSKSQILNGVISRQKHSVFFNRHCKGSTPHSLLMNGVVEIAWYCPGGKEDDIFDDCVAFFNLRGDAAEHSKQLDFLQAVSTVNVLLLSEHSMSESAKEISQKLSKSPVPFICLFSGREKIPQSKNPTKVKLAAKNRNQAEFTEELISSIKGCINASQQTASIEKCLEEAKKQHFIIDEDKKSCQEGNTFAQKLMQLLRDNMVGSLSTLKETVLPLQGNLWHDWCRKHKELYRLQHRKENKNIEVQQSEISSEMTKLRLTQLRKASSLGGFMELVLKCLTTHTKYKDSNLFMLQWFRIFLDDFTTDELAVLEQEYHSTWKQMKNIPKDKDTGSHIQAVRTKLDSITDKMAATTIGLQHIMREIGQLYETLRANNKNIQYATLPKIGMAMLVSGYPLELMDGDAAHVPITWITAVLDELINTLGDKKVFVLSILGLQSSGKSTLLNTMFGLQFAVSGGRCTRGAFMQLLKVDSSLRNELGYDFVLIVDTEGLRSPELSTKTSLNHDNELATFIIGIGDMTVINIMGENPSEMHDILQICVQAILRMKQVKITPSCIFVHQNVAESSAGDKNAEGRRRLQERLDEMAKMAAREENVDGITCFSDVIQFDIETQVFYFKNLLEGDPPMAPPNPSYSQNVQELKTRLLTITAWQDKSKMSFLSEFKCKVSDIWSALLQENFVFSFKNTVEMVAYSSLEHKYGAWSWELRKHSLSLQTKLENEIGSNVIQDVNSTKLTEEFDQKYNPLKAEIDKYFKESKHKETIIKWRENISIRFQNLKKELIESISNKAQELFTAKQSRSDLDEKRAKYTDQLTEQSKKLASILKTQGLADDKITEEFNKLWITWTTEVLKYQPTEKPLNVKAIVEKVLLDQFHNQPQIIDKVKGGLFKFDLKTHIQQSFWKWLFGSGGCNHNINIFCDKVNHAVNDYITAEENSKNDFNKNFIYKILTDIETKIFEFEKTPDNPKFTKEFLVDICVHFCLKYVSRLQRMHEQFKTANQPLTYLQSKKETYLQSFRNYCKGASSVTIFVDFLCKNLTPAVVNAANNKTCQQIADWLISNCQALNGNRSNLEYHILRHLAEQENFSLYEEYIDHPQRYFQQFIQDKVTEFCLNDNQLRRFFQENLQSLKNQLLTASMDVPRPDVSGKRSNASLWLESFCMKVGGIIAINRTELHSIENEDIQDWQFFKETMTRSLEDMIKDVQIDVGALREEPTACLYKQLEGCWAQCPFCGAICTNTIPNHDGDHSVKFHRCDALRGTKWYKTEYFSIEFCNTSVISDLNFIVNEKKFACKTYRTAGYPYNTWSITGDGVTQRYWKWLISKFRCQWEKKYNLRFTCLGEIPKEWETFTKEDVLAELQ